MNLVFQPAKETKGTWQFHEVVTGPLDVPKVGSLYVKKETLKEMGWNGDLLAVTVQLAGVVGDQVEVKAEES